MEEHSIRRIYNNAARHNRLYLYDFISRKYKKRQDGNLDGQKSDGWERELERDISTFPYFGWGYVGKKMIKMNRALNIHKFNCM